MPAMEVTGTGIVRFAGRALMRLERPRPYQINASQTWPSTSLSAVRRLHQGRSPRPHPLAAVRPTARLPALLSRRHASTEGTKAADDATSAAKPVKAKARHPALRLLYGSLFAVGIVVASSGAIVLGLFLYDATTYRTSPQASECPVSTLALNPRIGGPKNLPMAEHLLDDDDSPEKRAQKHKPKLVILGTGWGSIALLKNLNPDEYHVVVVSPSNHFLFTPMLPSATVGTVGLQSLMEPVRRIIGRVHGHFMKGMAVDVDFSAKLVEIEGDAVGEDGKKQRFYLPYDKLVVGVGSVTNPHGVPGLEHCHFLKDVSDARRIRNAVIRNLETASLPTTSDEERRRLLSFVVCGGGPTGVEVAAELYDLLNEDLSRFFPRLLRNEISVHIIQSRGHILNTYDEALSKYAETRFQNDAVDVQTNARVKEVFEDRVHFSQIDADGKVVLKEIPTGFTLWSTGVSQTALSRTIAEKLPEQKNRHALETDTHCRVLGTPLGDVYAIGDCSTVQNNVSEHIVSFLRTVAWEKGGDPESIHLTYTDWRRVAQKVKQRFPQAADHLRRLDKLFNQYDQDRSGTLDFGELLTLLRQIDAKLTSLPATAQRAHQQGRYLARKFNRLAQAMPGMELNQMEYGDLDAAVYRPFDYQHLGSLAYIGNAAIFDWGGGKGFGGGLLAVYLWRSIYFAQSVSLRTRVLMAMDWTKRAIFGRDMMNF